MTEPLLLVHGGAGDVPEGSRPAHLVGCLDAVRQAGELLAAGGTAMEAACTAVELLENNALMNAGAGCALDEEGGVSLDAAVMDGVTGSAGAVALLPAFKNPVRIAQRLLHEPEVFLGGEAAARWAASQGFRRLEDEDLITPASRAAWERVVRQGVASNWAGGTVGAVARDEQGRLAAATSTGGRMGKRPGRIGDTPVIGAGTWADEACAISATGDGEAFLRVSFAARLAEALRRGDEPRAGLQAILAEAQARYRGAGGAILITADGGPVAEHTTPFMSHAWWTPAEADCAG